MFRFLVFNRSGLSNAFFFFCCRQWVLEGTFALIDRF